MKRVSKKMYNTVWELIRRGVWESIKTIISDKIITTVKKEIKK